MRTIVAKNAGFCFGVERAISLTEELAEQGTETCTLGPLIHNDSVIARLAEKGVHAVDSISDCKGRHAVIRSHGVPQSVYDEMKKLGIEYTDATCPFVAKIHTIVSEFSQKGYIILIAGDENHPEVIGIKGHCKSEYFVIKNDVDIQKLFDDGKISCQNKLILVIQTTFDRAKWIEYKKNIEKLYTNIKIFDTICNATVNRQTEAAELAQKSRLMVVVGGYNSSNTGKLTEICSKYCRTIHIDEASKLSKDCLDGLTSESVIGITAGASTPAYIIKEVHVKMDEIIKDTENSEELNFAELFDQSCKRGRVYIGNRVKATVVALNNAEAVVDLGTKHSGYIPLDELTSDPNAKPADVVAVGDVIDAIVTQINDAEGVVYLSKKKVDSALGIEKLAKANEENATLEGVVANVVKGGVIIISNGTRVFIPASQTGVSREGKLDDLLKKTVNFKVIEVNEARGRVVGSIKKAYSEVRDAEKAKFWEEIEVGKKYTGEIKSMESYGVFVDLGAVDGMVHTSELTWNRIKHPKDIVSIGDKIDVVVKAFDIEKKRVSLSAKKPEDNPWAKFLADYKVGDVVKATVVSITPFGAFAQIIPGVDGLIHISQISVEKVNNVAAVLSVGQEVEAKITEIDEEKSRVSLSMKVLIEAAPAEETAETEETEN